MPPTKIKLRRHFIYPKYFKTSYTKKAGQTNAFKNPITPIQKAVAVEI